MKYWQRITKERLTSSVPLIEFITLLLSLPEREGGANSGMPGLPSSPGLL
jgi:hypothetical protein